MSRQISVGHPVAPELKSLAEFWETEILRISGLEIPEILLPSSFLLKSSNYNVDLFCTLCHIRSSHMLSSNTQNIIMERWVLSISPFWCLMTTHGFAIKLLALDNMLTQR
jgi:hypothetical protein